MISYRFTDQSTFQLLRSPLLAKWPLLHQKFMPMQHYTIHTEIFQGFCELMLLQKYSQNKNLFFLENPEANALLILEIYSNNISQYISRRISREMFVRFGTPQGSLIRSLEDFLRNHKHRSTLKRNTGRFSERIPERMLSIIRREFLDEFQYAFLEKHSKNLLEKSLE